MPTISRDQPSPTASTQRIAKLLARAGVASRREIERMIAEGRIALHGVAIDTPATLLASLAGVTVDGNPVAEAEPARLFLFHKPAGCLTTERDPAGRPTIYDRLPDGLPRLMPVGRLDFNTEGLLLMTTDGELKRLLELPATGVERAYRARAYGQVSQPQLEDLMEGVEIEGVRYGPIDANIERRTGANVWVEMILKEGKNREVRRVLEHLGLEVSRLIRTRYGPFVLGELTPGQIGEVRRHDVESFRAEPTRKELPQPSRKSGVAVVEPPKDAVFRETATGSRVEPESRLKRARPAAAKNEPRRRADGSVATRATGERNDRARSFRETRGDGAEHAARPTHAARPGAGGLRTTGPRSDARSADRSTSDRPRTDRAGPPARARTDSPRATGVRPDGPRTDRPRADSPRVHRSETDRPRPERARGNGPRIDRAGAGHTRTEGPRSERPRAGSPSAGRAGPRSDRPRAERSGSENPRGTGGRSDRPRVDSPRPGGPHSSGPRPSGGGRPSGSRGGPGKPRGPRGER